MAMNPLPPQAYTKETLQKAYQWLLTQNASIKEMASNQEILISLYLKAQRNGDASLEAPSIQNFKQELKSLASMMGDFQTPGSGPAMGSGSSFGASSSTAINQNAAYAAASFNGTGSSVQSTVQSTGQSTVQSTGQSTVQSTGQSTGQSTAQSTVKNNHAHSTATNDLDQHSLLLIQEVKMVLNLSSDTEALRALISLGHRQFKKINS